MGACGSHDKPGVFYWRHLRQHSSSHGDNFLKPFGDYFLRVSWLEGNRLKS
jgi:hypothetical protein